MHTDWPTAYLRRIGYRGSPTPTQADLTALHIAHLRTVPFENLDIWLGQTITLDARRVVYKIIKKRRGGFCYELNYAFYLLLRQLGFRARLISARVFDGTDIGPPFDHLCLIVFFDGQPWLADVGFGDSFVEPIPLPLHKSTELRGGGNGYRVHAVRNAWHMVCCPPGGPVEPQYQFDLVPRDIADFSTMCRFHQTSADSHFTRRLVCTRLIAHGRLTLAGRRLIRTVHGRRHESTLHSLETFSEQLRTGFDIHLENAASYARLWHAQTSRGKTARDISDI